MIKEKYKQLCLSLQFGGIRTITIHSRCASCEKKATAHSRTFGFAETPSLIKIQKSMHFVNTTKL